VAPADPDDGLIIPAVVFPSGPIIQGGVPAVAQGVTTVPVQGTPLPPVDGTRAMGAAPAADWRTMPPSRGYPSGVPELRPEFLHPVSPERPSP
jgi:hypothetical protein